MIRNDLHSLCNNVHKYREKVREWEDMDPKHYPLGFPRKTLTKYRNALIEAESILAEYLEWEE